MTSLCRFCLVLAILGPLGCSTEPEEDVTRDAGTFTRLDAPTQDAAGVTDVLTGDAAGGACSPVIASHASQGVQHVADNAGIVFNSNPPSSGPHCDVWGRYAVYTPARPLPRCNYLHNLEHGAVVLLYRCAEACPQIVAALEQLRAEVIDRDCRLAPRVIVTPDPQLGTMVAAAAWQSTWTSDCLDASARQSLANFIASNLGTAGRAPEALVCADGSVTP